MIRISPFVVALTIAAGILVMLGWVPALTSEAHPVLIPRPRHIHHDSSPFQFVLAKPIPGIVARETALSTALQHSHFLGRSDVTSSAQFGYFTDTTYGKISGSMIQPYIYHRPVWLVTFGGPGAVIMLSGDVSSAHPRVIPGAKVATDAATGQFLVLYAFGQSEPAP